MAAAALLLTLGGALFCRPAKHTQRVFRIGMNNLQPWIQADANGKASGLVVDLLSEAARRTGIRLEWSLVEGSSPGEAFAEGRVDMWPVVGVLEERRKMFHLTEPWLTSSFALVSREESPALTPSDVRGRTVAVTGVPISMKLAREFIGTADLNRVRGRKKVLTEVCEGKAYAGFEEASYLHSMLMKRPEPCFGVPLAVHLVRGAASSVAIASRREAAETADTLRSALDDMAADGAMGAVLDRWAPFSATEIRSMFALRELHERRSRLQWGIGISLGIACLLGWQMRRATLAAQRERLANSAKSEFLANMSHEIRTPMNGVLGMIDLVLSRPINEESRADLMVVRESGAALLAILTDILDLAKIEAGRLEIQPASFSPSACVNGVARMFEGLALAKDLKLSVRLEDDLPEKLYGDELRIRQILLNLVSNAVKFTDAGSVSIEARGIRRDDTGVDLEVDVRDTGIGISPEHRVKLFTKFTQADGSLRRRHGGTGLGLSIAKSLVQLMDGTLEVSSIAGVGSCFKLRVPLSIPNADEGKSSSVESRASEHVAVPSVGGGRILVAEDNLVNQMVLSRSLQKLGYEVDLAGNGAEAVEKWKMTKYDAILMDCQMPVMDGYQASEAIRKSEPPGKSIPIIAVTAHAMSGDEERCLAAGMTGYLAKPVRMSELARALDARASSPAGDAIADSSNA